MQATHLYKAFGLIFESELEIPELIESTATDAVDVTITAGDVPAMLAEGKRQGACFETAPGEFLFFLEGVGRFLALGGSKIVYQADAEATGADLRVFLLGSVFGAILQQRGLFPIHASAVEHEGAAIAFMGNSGIGKSTTAAAFLKRGCRLITDDVCAIQLVDGLPVVVPGYPQGKLWLDSMQQLEMKAADFEPIRNKVAKRAIPTREQFCEDRLPLKRIYQLLKSNTAVQNSGFSCRVSLHLAG